MTYTTEIITRSTIALQHYIPGHETGAKRLLFVHSSGHGSWMWKNFLHYFADRGYDSWALDLRGHSLAPPVNDWGAVGVAEYLQDIDDAVSIAGGQLVLVGHSMSGLLILKYAEGRSLAGLIVSQSGIPKSIMQKRGVDVRRPVPHGAKRLVADGVILPMTDRDMVTSLLFDCNNVDESAVDLVLEKIGKESAGAARGIAAMDVCPDQVSAPVFVLGFNTSKLGIQTPVDMNKILAEEYKARGLAVIEPGGHDYMLEKNWSDYARQFEAWLHFQD